LALLLALFVHCGVASAARFMPAPLLSQFEQGYGIVSAEVVDSKLTTPPKRYPALYDVVFKIHEVAAQPLQGEDFAFKSGDSITVRLSAGYACQIEDGVESVLAQGKCYYLILRRKKDGTFEHCDGASALRGVAKLDASETQYYARVRALAGEPKDRQLPAWVNVVTKPTESERLRSDALAGVFEKLWRGAEAADGDGASRALLRKLWNDPQANHSIALLMYLDYVLRATSGGFDDSADRREVWLKNLLALTPERRKLEKDENNLDNLAFFVLRDLAKRHPEATGQQLATRLNDKTWPALYRRAISFGLMTAYQYAERVDPKWEPALDAYFIDVSTDGEPYPIRVAAGDLAYCAGVESPGDSGARRWYSPNERVRTALAVGVERLKTASGRPGANQEFGTSASALARVLRLLDGPRKPLVPPMPARK
jgi:hypothetical protein